jgi:hypothetical protein
MSYKDNTGGKTHKNLVALQKKSHYNILTDTTYKKSCMNNKKILSFK